MDPKLVEAYTNGILLSEKKHHGDAKPLGDKGSKLQSKGGSVVKHAKAREFDLEKDVKLTAALKGSGTSRVKGLKSPQKLSDSYTGYSKFDSIFKKALMEELDEQPVPADVEGSEVDSDPGDVVDTSTVEASEGEGDIVSDLQDVVSKLNDILSTQKIYTYTEKAGTQISISSADLTNYVISKILVFEPEFDLFLLIYCFGL